MSDDQAEPEVLREFIAEANELLGHLEEGLIGVERDGFNASQLSAVFRSIHTLKGVCGWLGFSRLETLAHVAEGVLTAIRERRLAVSSEVITLLLRVSDHFRSALGPIEQTSREPEASYEDTIAALTAMDGAKPTDAPTASDAESPAAVDAGTHDTTVRVDVALLDTLMNQVGELVLARNQLMQFNNEREDRLFSAACQRLNLVTSELQEGIMKTRMQPLLTVCARLPRLVRDLGFACEKKVRLEMEGMDTELDRTILEAIRDPLVHILRNAIDHGIEPEAVRLRQGKPAEGHVLLRAFHEGGQVHVEVTDDGAGVDASRVAIRAVELGLVTRDELEQMSEREINNLVFAPGFSTAGTVTSISGRGVGMDVVRSNIERVGGTIDILTVQGRGTTIKIKIPLTLAIIPALIVAAGGHRYAVPQASLVELVRLSQDDGDVVEEIYGAPVYRLRGSLLPLVSLHAVLGLSPAHDEQHTNIVVLEVDGVRFGLLVSGIHDAEEIVVKPLGKQLKGLSVFAGATIMGDGKVALILDVVGIAQHASVLADASTRRHREEEDRTAAVEQRELMLLVGVGSSGRLVLPLSSVARLEEIPSAAIEILSGRRVVQYRGEVLSLLDVKDVLEERRKRAREPVEEIGRGDTLQVVVHAHDGRLIGFVVDRVIDIIDEKLDVKREGARAGVLGSAVVHGRITEMLDVAAAARAASRWEEAEAS